MLPKQHSDDWVRAIEHAVSRIEATNIVPGQTPEQLRDAIRQRVKDIAAPTYVVPDSVVGAPAPSWEAVRYCFALILFGATKVPSLEWEQTIDRAAEYGDLNALREHLAYCGVNGCG